MQRALERTSGDYLLFLQDDAQLVRPIESADLACIDNFFKRQQQAAFVGPAFLKGHRRRSIIRQIRPQAELQGYYQRINERLRPRPVSMYYCDLSIAHVPRLRAANWQFKESEGANAAQARMQFSKMLHMACPFVMHVPEVPMFRNKQTTLGARLAARLSGPDVKAFAYVSAAEIEAMRSRPLSVLPFAEDFLKVTSANVRKPFRYNAVSARLSTRILHKLEMLLKHRR